MIQLRNDEISFLKACIAAPYTEKSGDKNIVESLVKKRLITDKGTLTLFGECYSLHDPRLESYAYFALKQSYPEHIKKKLEESYGQILTSKGWSIISEKLVKWIKTDLEPRYIGALSKRELIFGLDFFEKLKDNSFEAIEKEVSEEMEEAMYSNIGSIVYRSAKNPNLITPEGRKKLRTAWQAIKRELQKKTN